MPIDPVSTRRQIALVVLTGSGLALALRVQNGLRDDVRIYASQRVLNGGHSQVEANALIGFSSVRSLLTDLWQTQSQLVLFFALLLELLGVHSIFDERARAFDGDVAGRPRYEHVEVGQLEELELDRRRAAVLRRTVSYPLRVW